MASRKVTMKKVRIAIRQLRSGCSLRTASEISGISKTSVTNIKHRIESSSLGFEDILELKDSELSKVIYPNQRSKDPRFEDLQSRIPDILNNLKQDKENLLHLWENYQDECSSPYSYPQFCHHIKKYIDSDPDTHAVLKHKFGETMFIDFAGDFLDESYSKAIQQKLRVFVAILPGSHLTYVGLSPDESRQSWIEQSTKALKYFGGSPRYLVCDNAKALVYKASRYEGEVSEPFRRFAEHYKMEVLPTRPAKPQDKGLVENAVNNIYRFIFPRLRDREHESRHELNEHLSELLRKYNEKVMRAYKQSRRELFEENEKDLLQQLPETDYIFESYQPPRKVGTQGHIYLKEDRNYYSVPYRYAGKSCEIYYNSTLVSIYFDNERICCHRRSFKPNHYSTSEEHLNPKFKDFLCLDKEKANSSAREIGRAVEVLIEHIFHKQAHEITARKSVLGLFDMAKKYGRERLSRACEMAISDGNYYYRAVKKILENDYDLGMSEQLEFDQILNENPNKRHTNKE